MAGLPRKKEGFFMNQFLKLSVITVALLVTGSAMAFSIDCLILEET